MIFEEFVRTCAELQSEGQSYAVVTIVQIDAHVPQEVGAKMIITDNGLHSGTIGGGKIEAKGISLALEILKSDSPQPSLHRINLNQDLGMVCGGVATLFIESSKQASWSIALYGAGHVGQALTRLLLTFSCQLHCVDVREEWLAKLPDHPRLKKILTPTFSQIPATMPQNTYHVIATQGHTFDLEVVREVLKLSGVPYIGVIGSKVKARTVRATLMSEGLSEQETQRFHCPMGLPIGNNTPAEIAVSIAAQLLETKGSLSQTHFR
jgi:xanthine dehydrogenase accessory factor